MLFRPVTVACGHSFCRECLSKSLQLKSECPTCRSPCAMLGVNIVLAEILEDRFPEEYETRRMESLEVDEPQDALQSTSHDTERYPVILVADSAFSRLVPGVRVRIEIDLAQRELSNDSIAFATRTGARRVCVLRETQTATDNRVGVLIDVLGVQELAITCKTLYRLLSVEECMFDASTGCVMGKFSRFGDICHTERSVVISCLRAVKIDLARQKSLIGETGMSQLISRLSDSASTIFGSSERGFITSGDVELSIQHIQRSVSFEPLSFVLMLLVEADIYTKVLMVETGDTFLRLESIARILKARSTVFALDSVPRSAQRDILRFNSKWTAFGLIVILLFLMYLKGSGYLTPSHRSVNFV